jgi:hypothetical protein
MAFTALNTPTSLSPADLTEVEGTARWARLVAITGFALLGLMLVFSIVFSRMLGQLLAMQALMTGQAPPFDPSAMGILYVVVILFVCVLYFFPTLFLFQFATRTLRAVRGGFDAPSFSRGLQAHRSFYAYIGILVIILGVLNVLAFVGLAIAFANLPTLPAGMDMGGVPM